MVRSYKKSKKGVRGKRGFGKKRGGYGQRKTFRVKGAVVNAVRVPPIVARTIKKLTESKHIDLVSGGVGSTALSNASDNPFPVEWTSEEDSPAAIDKNLVRIVQGSGAHERDGQIAHVEHLDLSIFLRASAGIVPGSPSDTMKVRLVLVLARSNYLDTGPLLRDVLDFGATDAFGANADNVASCNMQRMDNAKNFRILYDETHMFVPQAVGYDTSFSQFVTGGQKYFKKVRVPVNYDVKFAENTTTGQAGTVQNGAIYLFAFRDSSTGPDVYLDALCRIHYFG